MNPHNDTSSEMGNLWGTSDLTTNGHEFEIGDGWVPSKRECLRCECWFDAGSNPFCPECENIDMDGNHLQKP